MTPVRALPSLIALAIALLLTACNSGSDSPSAPAVVAGAPTVPASTSGLPGEAMTILTADGTTVDLRAEIAQTQEERARGLMGRTDLAPDSGMLFVIEPPGRGFYMRGTTIPLTVAFMGSCGEFVDFADLEPLSEEIKNTDLPYTFALEMTRGWFDDNGIVAGDTLQLPRRLRSQTC